LSRTENKKPKFFYGYIVVVAGFIVLVILNGTLYSFGVFLKPLAAEFGWTRAMTAGAYSMFMFLCGFLYIISGRLNDRFGPRVVMTASGFCLGLGYLLMSRISAIWQLYLFFGVIAAIGHSGGFVPLTSTIARWFVRRRGLMTGLVVSGIGIGTIIMPPIATRLILNYGWRTSYFIMGIVALVVIIIAAQFLRRDPGQIDQLPYGVSEAKQDNLIAEARGLSLREAIHTRQFWMLCVLFLSHGVGQQAVIVHIAPHATDLGISTILAANILSIIGGLSIAGRVGMGSASDRIGIKSTLIIGLTLLSVALFWLVVAKELWMLYSSAILFGVGYGAMMALVSPIVADLFGLRAHGTILGVASFAMMIGGGTGPLMAGQIFDITGSYQLGFLLSAVLSVIALVMASLLRSTRREGLV